MLYNRTPTLLARTPTRDHMECNIGNERPSVLCASFITKIGFLRCVNCHIQHDVTAKQKYEPSGFIYPLWREMSKVRAWQNVGAGGCYRCSSCPENSVTEFAYSQVPGCRMHHAGSCSTRSHLEQTISDTHTHNLTLKIICSRIHFVTIIVTPSSPAQYCVVARCLASLFAPAILSSSQKMEWECGASRVLYCTSLLPPTPSSFISYLE